MADYKPFVCWILVTVDYFHTSTAESGFFWHVTDLHYDPTYWTNQLSCTEPVQDPGMFGDYMCDSNWRLAKDSIANMASIERGVDFVLWTGDSMGHIGSSKSSLSITMEVIQNITDAFKMEFPGVAVVPSLGNHDFYPSNQANVKRDKNYNRTADIWKEWIPADELQRFVNGGFYAKQLGSKIRLMALNTNLYHTRNRFVNKSMEDPAGQFAWMESVLQQGRLTGEKVILTAHVTPGVYIPNRSFDMDPDLAKRYVDTLLKYHDVIITSLYGHDHSDNFKIVQDIEDNSRSVAQFVAPSVTPRMYYEHGSLIEPHNPGIRLVEYDRVAGQHLNYVQYYINLTDTNANKKSDWTKLYDFRETYQVPDMSVKSLRSIFDRMSADDESGMALAQTYCNNALVSKEAKECTQRNRFEIVCGGKHYDLDQTNKCVEKMMAGGALPSAKASYVIYFTVSIFILAIVKSII